MHVHTTPHTQILHSHRNPPPPESGAMTRASAQRRSSMCTTGSPTASHCRHSSSSPAHWEQRARHAGMGPAQTFKKTEKMQPVNHPPTHPPTNARAPPTPRSPSTGPQAGGSSQSWKKRRAERVATTRTSANCSSSPASCDSFTLATLPVAASSTRGRRPCCCSPSCCCCCSLSCCCWSPSCCG